MAQPQSFGIDDDVIMLKDAARRFLDEREPLLGLRTSLAGTEDPYRGTEREGWFDPAAWREMTELGWPLVAVPEPAGGLGLGLVAATAIQEEIGRAACPTPLSSTLMTTFVLRAASADACLGRIAAGGTMALAVFGPDGAPDADSTAVTADGNRLTGISHFVQDAQKVDGFVVAARADAAVELGRAVRTEVGRFRGAGLGHARASERILRVVVEGTGCVVDQRAGAVGGYHHVDDGVLHGLKEANRPFELHPRLGVLGGSLQLPLCSAGDIGRNQRQQCR